MFNNNYDNKYVEINYKVEGMKLLQSKQTPEVCLEAVKNEGYILRDVKDEFKTPEMCLVAVKNDGYALKFVKEQSLDICLEAVRQNSTALKYVNDCFIDEVKRQLNI